MPPASFRPHLTMDPLPLAVCLLWSYRTRDFHPLDYTHAGRTPLWCLTAPPSPRGIGRATKGKRLYGQARRLTSPDLHILCRMCTVDNKALKSSLLIIDSIMPLHRGWQRNWIHRREKRPTNQVPLPPQGDTRTLQDLPSSLQW